VTLEIKKNFGTYFGHQQTFCRDEAVLPEVQKDLGGGMNSGYACIAYCVTESKVLRTIHLCQVSDNVS